MAASRTGPGAKKDPDQRLGHRTKAEMGKTRIIDADANESYITTDLEPNPNWHPVALTAWNTFCESPLRVKYESTDYVQAWVTAELIHHSISGRMSAGQAMQLRMYMNDLGFTEGARKSLDIQIKRQVEAPDPQKVVAFERMNARKAQ